MVKIPNLDDLKKMGAGLIDSAKSFKYNEVVDKLKSGVEAVSGKKGGPVPQGDDAMKVLFQGMNDCINEMLQLHAAQMTAMKKMQSHLADLARVIEATASTETKQTEDKKSDETKPTK